MRCKSFLFEFPTWCADETKQHLIYLMVLLEIILWSRRINSVALPKYGVDEAIHTGEYRRNKLRATVTLTRR